MREFVAALSAQLAPRYFPIALDILIVAYLIYRVILLIRGTRTMQMLIGFIFLLVLLYISQKLELSTLHWITNNFFSYIVLVIIILFQNEIRSALSQMGYRSLFSSAHHPRSPKLVSELVQAAFRLSAEKIGALVVIEQRTSLRGFVSLGMKVDAEPTAELLMAIFEPYSPMHDGAVILQQGRIATAGCFLPLSTNADLDKSFGTRHRAALGITEESDALVLVVSEETGAVSLVHQGRIQYNIDEAELMSELTRRLVGEERDRPATSGPKTADART